MAVDWDIFAARGGVKVGLDWVGGGLRGVDGMERTV